MGSKEADAVAEIVLQPLVHVHGRLTCSEIGGEPERTNVRLYLRGGLGECPSDDGHFSFFVPPGAYTLFITGSVYKDHRHTIEPTGTPLDLDLGTIEVPVSRVAALRGEPAPELQFDGASGWSGYSSLSELHGRWVLLAFWNYRGLENIRDDIPRLMDLRTTYAQDLDLFQVLTIHIPFAAPDERLKTFEAFEQKLEEHRSKWWRGRTIPWPILFDADGSNFQKYGTSLGDYVLIDPQGRVVGRDDETLSELERLIHVERERVAAFRETLSRVRKSDELPEAVHALTRSPYAAATRALADHAASCSDSKVASLFDLLGRTGGRRALAVLTGKAGLGAEKRRRRIAAAEAIALTGDTAAVPALLAVLAEPKVDSRLVAPVCLSLARVGRAHAEATAAVLERTRDKSARTREAAAEAVGWLDAPEVLETLERLVTKESNAGVRRGALRGLTHVGTPEARALLSRVAEADSSGSIREAARAALDASEAQE